jgi:serine/threonine protein kinase
LNVLLDDNFQARIADFGESILDTQRTTIGSKMSVFNESGTPGWAAPELIVGKGVSKASDVFSFGIILWELLTWRVPSIMVSVRMMQLDELRKHPAVIDHPLINMIREQRQVSQTGRGILAVFSDAKKAQREKARQKKKSRPAGWYCLFQVIVCHFHFHWSIIF